MRDALRAIPRWHLQPVRSGQSGLFVLVRIGEPAGADGGADLASLVGVAEALLMVPEVRIETLEMAHAAGARTIALGRRPPG